MAVLTVDETTEDRAADKDTQGRDYRRSFIVLFDEAVPVEVSDPLDARLAVADPGFVTNPAYVGAPHPEDTSVFCRRVTPRQRRESRRAFDVIAEYGQYTQLSDAGVENPLDRPPEISVGSVQYMKVLEQDYSVTPLAVVNSVGQPFDPGLEIPVVRSPLIVVQNEEWVSVALMYEKVRIFDNTVNSGEYYGADAGTLRVRVHGTRMFQTGIYAGNPYYSRMQYELEHNPDGWQSEGKILDQGMMQWVFVVDEWQLERIKTDAGEPVPDPWPLNGSGQALTRDDINAGNFAYREFTVYRERDFTGLELQI